MCGGSQPTLTPDATTRAVVGLEDREFQGCFFLTCLIPCFFFPLLIMGLVCACGCPHTAVGFPQPCCFVTFQFRFLSPLVSCPLDSFLNFGAHSPTRPARSVGAKQQWPLSLQFISLMSLRITSPRSVDWEWQPDLTPLPTESLQREFESGENDLIDALNSKSRDIWKHHAEAAEQHLDAITRYNERIRKHKKSFEANLTAAEQAARKARDLLINAHDAAPPGSCRGGKLQASSRRLDFAKHIRTPDRSSTEREGSRSIQQPAWSIPLPRHYTYLVTCRLTSIHSRSTDCRIQTVQPGVRLVAVRERECPGLVVWPRRMSYRSLGLFRSTGWCGCTRTSDIPASATAITVS